MIKRYISIFLCFAILMTQALSVSATEIKAEQQEISVLPVKIKETGKVKLLKAKVEDNIVLIDAEGFVDLLPDYEIFENAENCLAIERTSDDVKYYFYKEKKNVTSTSMRIERYEAPIRTFEEDGTVWIPFVFTLKLLDLDAVIDENELQLSTKPYMTVQSICRKVLCHNYLFHWEDYGFSKTDEIIMVSASAITCMLEDFLTSCGLSLIRVVAEDFTMDSEYADKLCSLLVLQSYEEYENNAKKTKEVLDLFSDEGPIHDITKRVSAKSVNDMIDTVEKMSDSIKETPSFILSSDYQKALSKLSYDVNSKKVADTLATVGQFDISKEVKAMEYMAKAMEVLAYANDFEHSDQFSMDSVLELLDSDCEKIMSDTSEAIIRKKIDTLKTSPILYSGYQYVMNNLHDMAGEGMSKALTHIDPEAMAIELGWSLSKNFIPFLKNGLALTDNVTLLEYSVVLGADSFNNFRKYYKECDIKEGLTKDNCDKYPFYNIAKAAFLHLKSGLVSRDLALKIFETKGLKGSGGYKKLEREKDEIVELLSVLRNATEDTSNIAVYGVIPLDKFGEDSTELINLVKPSTALSQHLYSSIIESYSKAVNSNDLNKYKTVVNKEAINSYKTVEKSRIGYTLYDIDNNGIPELIMGLEQGGIFSICDIWTHDGDKPVSLINDVIGELSLCEELWTKESGYFSVKATILLDGEIHLEAYENLDFYINKDGVKVDVVHWDDDQTHEKIAEQIKNGKVLDINALAWEIVGDYSKRPVISNPEEIWIQFLTCGDYKKYIEKEYSSDNLEYVVYDLDADDIPELLIQYITDMPFYTTWLFALDGKDIKLIDKRYGYGQYRYSPKQNMILISPQTKPYKDAGAQPFYWLKNNQLQCAFQILQDYGTFYYAEDDKKIRLSDKERESYFEDVIMFEWLPVKNIDASKNGDVTMTKTSDIYGWYEFESGDLLSRFTLENYEGEDQAVLQFWHNYGQSSSDEDFVFHFEPGVFEYDVIGWRSRSIMHLSFSPTEEGIHISVTANDSEETWDWINNTSGSHVWVDVDYDRVNDDINWENVRYLYD